MIYSHIYRLVKGGELFDELVRRKTFHEHQAVSIMNSLLSSIAYCHERNIIHRDLKPENILLDNHQSKSSFDIKVIDFGAAVFLDPGQLHQDRFGTVYYVAPEIVKGKGYNSKCDVWSMGVILFALLCGEVPFFSSKDKETLQLVIAGKFHFKQSIWA